VYPESTDRYQEIEMDDALKLAEQTEATGYRLVGKIRWQLYGGPSG
jgi:hypothetical protein